MIPLQAPDARKNQKCRGGSSAYNHHALVRKIFSVLPRLGSAAGLKTASKNPDHHRQARRRRRPVSKHSESGNLRSAPDRERPCPDKFFPACSEHRTRWPYGPRARTAQAVAAASERPDGGRRIWDPLYRSELSNRCWSAFDDAGFRANLICRRRTCHPSHHERQPRGAPPLGFVIQVIVVCGLRRMSHLAETFGKHRIRRLACARPDSSRLELTRRQKPLWPPVRDVWVRLLTKACLTRDLAKTYSLTPNQMCSPRLGNPSPERAIKSGLTM